MTTSKGGRPATGSIKWMRNAKTGQLHWHGRVTKGDGSRPWAPLDPSIPREDEARARTCAIETAVYFKERPTAGAEVKETVGEWFVRFHKHKEARGLSSVEDMRGRAKKWILPGIEHKDPRAVTREDMEGIVRRLDRAVLAWTKAGGKRGSGVSPSTATNVWGDVVHAFDEMVRAKDPGLRALLKSPCADVRGPDAGDDREGQILYSDELVALLRGVPVDPEARPVPLYRRKAYAMAVYTKTRAGELEALCAADVDLARQTITIEKQADRKSKGRAGTKATKTRKVRTIDIEPNLLPLVELLVKAPEGKAHEGKGRRLLRMPPPEDRAELLRADLLTVGVTRKALHNSNESQRAIVFHDLRDTGLTHMALRGDAPLVIQWTGGHTDLQTTQGYIDRGRVERQRIGDPLPPLPPELLPEGPRDDGAEAAGADVEGSPAPAEDVHEDAPTGLDPSLDLAELTAETSYVSAMLGRSQRELNPCYRRERPVS